MLAAYSSLRRVTAPHKRRNFFFLSRVNFSTKTSSSTTFIADDEIDAQRYAREFKAYRRAGPRIDRKSSVGEGLLMRVGRVVVRMISGAKKSDSIEN